MPKIVLLFGITQALFAGTVTGTVLYQDKTFDASGFTGTTNTPVPFARIELQNAGGTVLAATETDLNGAFSASVGEAVGKVKVFTQTAAGSASGFVARVMTLSNAVYAVTLTPGNQADTGNLNVPVITTTNDAMNLFNMAITALKYARDALEASGNTWPAPSQELAIIWPDSITGFDPAPKQVHIKGTGSDHDEFDDTVILHECGHFMSTVFSKDDSPGGAHQINQQVDARLAWSEGWATFFGNATRRHAGIAEAQSAVYVDTNDTGVFSFNIETPSLPAEAVMQTNELAICACLWDIADSNDEVDANNSDGVSGAAAENALWRSFRNRIPTYALITLEDFTRGLFLEAVSATYNATVGTQSVAGIYKSRKIFQFVDANEPNDSIAQAPIVGTFPFTFLARTFVPSTGPSGSFPDDEFVQVQVSAATTLKVETLNLGDGADTVLEVYDSTGTTLLAQNNNKSVSDKGSLVQLQVSAGSYIIKCYPLAVSPQVTEFGYYDLTISNVANADPVIGSVAASTTTGAVPLTLTFTASASDADGGIDAWYWDFEGDGAFEAWLFNGSSVTYTYRSAGTFQAKLRVIDSFGASAEATTTITATTSAAGSGTLSQSATTGNAPLTVDFTANLTGFSSAEFYWDFDGDGLEDMRTSGNTAQAIFRKQATFTPVVKVLGTDGIIRKITGQSTTVSVAAPFTASLGTSSNLVQISEAFTLTVTTSATTPTFSWDFEGDGIVDLVSTTTSVSGNYSVPGLYAARVRVIDSSGVEVDATTNIRAIRGVNGAAITEPQAGTGVAGDPTFSGYVYPFGTAKSVSYMVRTDNPQGAFGTIGSASGFTGGLFQSTVAGSTFSTTAYDLRLNCGSASTPDNGTTFSYVTTLPEISESLVGTTYTKQKTFKPNAGAYTATKDGLEIFIPDGINGQATDTATVQVGGFSVPSNGSLAIYNAPFSVSLSSGQWQRRIAARAFSSKTLFSFNGSSWTQEAVTASSSDGFMWFMMKPGTVYGFFYSPSAAASRSKSGGGGCLSTSRSNETGLFLTIVILTILTVSIRKLCSRLH